MDCKQAQALLSAYADGEIDARGSMEFEQHLQGCGKCSRALESVRQAKRLVPSCAPVYRVPAKLRSEIQSAVQIAPSPRRRPTTAILFAAGLLIVFFIGWTLGRAPRAVDIQSIVVSSHVRALMSDHIADVVSTDKHTVKPWFNGKIDFAPPVNDFAKQGYPLKGARLEYIDGRRLAVLVYGRNKHEIDVFIQPSVSDFEIQPSNVNGFNLLHWSKGGFEYWAVSDLNEAELRELAELLRQANS